MDGYALMDRFWMRVFWGRGGVVCGRGGGFVVAFC